MLKSGHLELQLHQHGEGAEGTAAAAHGVDAPLSAWACSPVRARHPPKNCVNTEGAAVQGDSVTVLPLLPLAYVASTHGSWDGCIPLALGDIWKYSSQGLYGILSQTSCSCANMTVNQSSKPLNSGHHMVHWVLLFAKSCMPESLLERRHPSGLLLEVKWFLAAAHSH